MIVKLDPTILAQVLSINAINKRLSTEYEKVEELPPNLKIHYEDFHRMYYSIIINNSKEII